MGDEREPGEAAPGEERAPGGAERPDLEPAEIRARAAGGAALLGARGALVMALGVAANIYLARRLGPDGFGIAALGMTMVVLGQFLTGGLGAALIRSRDLPGEPELASALGYQLLGAIAFCAIATAITGALTDDGSLIALMLVAVPVAVVRMPASVLLERQLSYGVIATIDVAEGLFFYAWAVVGVALGADVWGYATAVVARAVLGTLLMAKMGPVGFLRPRLDWSLTSPLVPFGLRYQAAAAGGVARDQGLNIGIASIGGIDALGIWSLANRVLQVPLLGMRSVLRVAYPAMSRLVGAGGDPAAALNRGTGVIAIAVAYVLVLIAGAAPAGIPALLGDEWDAVPAILLLASAGLMISIPVATMAIGYLFATGRAGIVAVAAVCETAAALAITLPLVPVIGVEAAGLAWIAIAIADLLVLGRLATRASGARMLRAVALPFVIASAAGGAAAAVSASGRPSLWLAAVACLVGVATLSAGFLLLRRELLALSLGLAKTGLRGIVRPDSGRNRD